MSVHHSLDVWKLGRLKLLAFETSEVGDGEVKGTGLLNPLLRGLNLAVVMYLQSQFYAKYHVATWRGKRVANPFAPPVGSRPQFRALKALAKSHLTGISYPLACTFAVTYRCQLQCRHCSAARHVRKEEQELSTAEAKRVIDESLDMGVAVIAFTGGEPLLRKDIFELISYVDPHKAVAHLFTNGLLLTEDVVDKLQAAGLYTLFVSLDSVDPEEHDRLRGRAGVFRAAVEGVQRALDKGLMVCLSSYASRRNTEADHYRRMHELGKKLGVHMVVLFDCVPTGALLHDTSDMLTPEQKEMIGQYNSYLFHHGIRPVLAAQAWQNSVEGYLSGIGCVAGHLQYYVSAYGDVTPCDFTPLSFGSLRQESLKHIWARMVHHPAYHHVSRRCRMQNPQFRAVYIDPIPDDAGLPYPIHLLPQLDYRTLESASTATSVAMEKEYELERG